MKSKAATKVLLIAAFSLGARSVSWSQLRAARGPVTPIGVQIAPSLSPSLQPSRGGPISQSPALNAASLKPAPAPNAAPVGLFPPAAELTETLPGATALEGGSLSPAPEAPNTDMSPDAGASFLTSRSTLEGMERAAGIAPEKIGAYFTGAREFEAFASAAPADGLTTDFPGSGTNFFGALRPFDPSSVRRSDTPKNAIDLSPIVPSFAAVPAIDAVFQKAAAALLKKLKLYRADMRLFISELAGFSRSLMPLGFAAVP